MWWYLGVPAGRLPDSEHFHELGFAPHSTGIVASLELLHSRPTESVKTSQLSPGLDPDWRAIIFHRACPAALDSLQGVVCTSATAAANDQLLRERVVAVVRKVLRFFWDASVALENQV